MPDHDSIPASDGNSLPFAKNLYAFALANFARRSVPGPHAVPDARITAFEAAKFCRWRVL